MEGLITCLFPSQKFVTFRVVELFNDLLLKNYWVLAEIKSPRYLESLVGRCPRCTLEHKQWVRDDIADAPVAQSVSARYLYSSTCEKCRGCEFEPHLEQCFNCNTEVQYFKDLSDKKYNLLFLK